MRSDICANPYEAIRAKAFPQSEQFTPVFVRHTNRMKCVHHLQYRYPGPLNRKGYIGKSFSQLMVSMGEKENVLERIGDQAFLNKFVCYSPL